MKIIHLLTGKANPATTMNGVNLVVDAYARRMTDSGHDVEVWGICRNPTSNRSHPPYALRLFQHFRSW